MKLFRVEVSKVIYVLAENEAEAEFDAPGHAEEESSADVFVSEANTFEAVESEWRDALPYGSDGDMTIRQFFERAEEPKPFVDPPEQQRLWS
jgi:hypothetical protein